jgi:nicotinate-nucleotide pyrophosphorylase (carboxylating)
MSASFPHLARQITWDEIPVAPLRQLLQLAMEEDVPPGKTDVTTQTFPSRNQSSRAELVARQPLVPAGLPLIPLILDVYGGNAEFEAHIQDGDPAKPGISLGVLSGNPSVLLTAERILLNFLQHLSGVATLTRTYVDTLGDSSTRLLDTRKTTPGFRLLEKYAVTCGGGWNHRLGLYDRVLIKDNHLHAFDAQSGAPLQQALELARSQNPDVPVEVEIDSLEQLTPALSAGPDCILLDNFSPDDIRRAVAMIAGKTATEASGGITLETLPDYAHLGLDFISTGATVHQSQWIDIGLDWLN